MRHYRLTMLARFDLHGLFRHIAKDSLARARKMGERIIRRCERLAENPFLGAECSQHGMNMRFFAVKPYVIYYRPIDDGVVVARILHGSRDADAELA